MSLESVEEKFTLQPFKLYKDYKNYLISKEDYNNIMENVIKATACVHKKTRNEYCLLTKNITSYGLVLFIACINFY